MLGSSSVLWSLSTGTDCPKAMESHSSSFAYFHIRKTLFVSFPAWLKTANT